MAIVTATDSDILHVVGDRMKVLLDGAATDGSFELFDFEGDKGSGPPPHAHPWLESYYVLDGEMLIEWGDQREIVGPGTTAVIPPLCLHRFEIMSPLARFLIATTGDRASRFFADLSANAPGAPTPENLPGIIEVAKRNGLTSPLFD
ncbi:MAG TPA: cupin domain-containing protein [Acidimicrobiales bacterium]|nr:cupin domain-containing protein [Acidimicrobiales bacterium]